MIHVDKLECFCTKDGVPTRVADRKFIPFEFETPAYGIEPITLSLSEGAPFEELTLVNSIEFEQYRDEALSDFVAAAMEVKPKKRNKDQRQAIAQHRQQQSLVVAVHSPLAIEVRLPKWMQRSVANWCNCGIQHG